MDQLKATYPVATGKRLKLKSGGPGTGVTYIEGDLRQLAQEVNTACELQSLRLE